MSIADPQHEREQISARTKAALAAARARGVQLGKPENLSNRNIGSARGNAVKTAKARARAEDLAPTIEEMKAAGTVSLRAMAEGLNARSIPAPHGGRWSAAQVARVEARLREQCVEENGSALSKSANRASVMHRELNVPNCNLHRIATRPSK